MKLAVWLAGLLLLVSMGVAEATVQVELDGDRLTIKAENASLRDILQAVAKAGQFPLRLEAPLTEKLTVQIDRKPVLEALDSLLEDQSNLIRYTRKPDGVRVEEVLVFAPSPSADRTARARREEVSAPGASAVPAGEAPASTGAAAEASRPKKLVTALDLLTGDQAETGRSMLVDLMKTDEDPGVRQQALFALGSAPTIPLPEVAKAAVADEDPSVRLVALKILADKAQDDPSAQSVFRQISQNDKDEQVRQVATALLGGS